MLKKGWAIAQSKMRPMWMSNGTELEDALMRPMLWGKSSLKMRPMFGVWKGQGFHV